MSPCVEAGRERRAARRKEVLFMNLGPVMLPPVNALANGIFGLMIEFFTTAVFKQPALAAPRKIERALKREERA
jgi:hypothetical protein